MSVKSHALIQVSSSVLCAFLIFGMAQRVMAVEVYNLTGLPAYPNFSIATMDEVSRTDKLGHRCSRFSGTTGDSLDSVVLWYRKKLVGASETDLKNDERYAGLPNLTGVKLAVGIDYVTVYRTATQSLTTIELFRCSAAA